MPGINPKFTNREGQSRKMKVRQLRLTDDENEMLNELLAATGLTLRDLVSEMIDERYRNEFER